MMSSAETLNFGPQWLRDLSEGSSTSPTSPPTVQTTPVIKFKLAENRYGREELLALFVEDSEVPEELNRAPSLVSEVLQVPLAFRPLDEHSRASVSTSFRGRGGVSSGLRGRSIPSRGRGRGRGSGAWADQDDGPLRRPPLLRRSESEGWRNDSLRGKGDGAEDIMGGLKEWRTVGGGQRPDFWKDTRRERQGDANEPRYARGRSLSSRDADDSDRRWHEDGLDEAAANSKQPDFTGEPPDSGKEPTKANDIGGGDKKEVQSKDGETSDSPPAIGVTTNGLRNTRILPNSSDTLPERPLKSLEPVPEARETPETGQGGGAQQNQTPPKERGIDPILQTSINPLEDMFQKLSANDSGDVLENGPRIFQEAQKSEPYLASLNGGQVSQTHPFSSNLLLGDIPATSNSPIAKLQALATTWFYKDPQGDVQGPFSSTQMMEWFNAGYFTMVLLVKRACDTEFVPLGELIKKWGHVPFTSSPKLAFPNSLSTDGSASSLMQQKFAEQQQMQYLKLLQGQKQQQQKQRQLHQQPPLHQQQQQHQMKPQPPPIGRSYQQQANLELILAKFSKSQDFRQLSPQHQQHIVLQYAEELKRQSMVADVARGVPIQPAVTNDSLNVLNTHSSEPIQPQQDALFQQQQRLLGEARKEEEKEIRRIQKQQEEQNEIIRKQEEFRRNNVMLLREAEQIKLLQLEAQRKKEELQRKIVEDERLKKIREMKEMERRRLLEEEERRRQEEERERRDAELRRIQEEEECKRKEEERRRLEEEKTRRLEEKKQEELRRLELEKEEQKKLEERRRREEYERQLAKEVEIQRKAEVLRIQKEKMAEAQALLKKQQQEKQMRQMQLPSHAKWGHNQPLSSKNDSLSLTEIQKIEQHEEQSKLREEARMVRENRNQVPKPKTGWGATDQGAHGVSLLDIQREEEKQMSWTKQAAKPEEVLTLNFNTSWNKPPKIQPDAPKPQTSFWDQVVEENPKKTSPPKQNQSQQQQQKKQAKQQPKGAKKVKGDEGKQIKALFQQQITKDSFTDWCESYLRNMTVGSIDIPTFINFLRDVESPYEVQEYVQSYLGESKEAKDFTTLFLEQRAKLGGYDYKVSSTNKSDQESRTATARDTDGFEVVTSNTKRGKKKLRKLQKVDPSILGFSVNASSDRVNMGEIQTTND